MVLRMNQLKTPVFDAVKRYVESNVIQFHVPGHKQGAGLEELREYIGETALKMDANGMEDLDLPTTPRGLFMSRRCWQLRHLGLSMLIFW